jgi:hypothetical protein
MGAKTIKQYREASVFRADGVVLFKFLKKPG